MGTIGPKPNPRPLILHVDSDTNIPYRLAESDVLVVSSITASSYNNLPSIGGATSINQLAGTGVFLTTATNVTSLAGTGTFATTSFLTNNYTNNVNLPTTIQTEVESYNYVGPINNPNQGDIAYWDGSKWNQLSIGNTAEVLTVVGTVPSWQATAGSVSIPVAINQGGTNTTATPTTNGVIYYNGTRYVANSNLTFNGTTLTANTLALTNALTAANGGTGVTALASLNVQSFGGLLPVNKGGTNSTTQQNNGVLYYNNATTAVTSVTSLTFNGTALSTPELTVTQNPITVNSGGTGRSTLTAGNFLVGNGTSQVTFQPTATYVTTSFANANYFNKSTDVLSIAQGGTNSTLAPDSNTLLFYNSNTFRYEGNESILIGTSDKLICGSGVAIPSKQIYVASNGDLNPGTLFKLNDLPGVNVPSPANGDLLSYNNPNWVNISVLPIANGGTNTTATPITNGVIYYDGTRYVANSNLTFTGTTLNANTLTLANALAVAQGGTGATNQSSARTNLGLGNLATSNSISLNNLSNVNITSPTTNQVLSYNGTNWVNSTPSGGSSETWTTVFLQNDELSFGTSLGNSQLSAALISSKTYSYEFNIIFNANATSKIDFKLDSPTVDSHYWIIDYTIPPATSFTSTKRSKSGTGVMAEQEGLVDATGNGSINIKGTINPSVNGNLIFQFALNNGTDAATIYAGSYLKYAAIN